MRRILQVVALLMTAVAVVATSAEPGEPMQAFSFDLVTREEAVYEVGFAYPPQGEVEVIATFDAALQAEASQAVPTPLVIAVGDELPTPSGLAAARRALWSGDTVEGLGRVFFAQTLEGAAAAGSVSLTLSRERPTYLSFVRADRTPVQISGTFQSSAEPCDEPGVCGALVITDVTRGVQ